MKFIKSYKIFESQENETFQLLDVLNDLLLPISDLGYNCSLFLPVIQHWGPFYKVPSKIIIRIVTYLDKNPLDVTKEIISDFDRINDYLESNGFRIEVKGVTLFNAKIELSYETFINGYLGNGLSIRSFRNLSFVANKIS